MVLSSDCANTDPALGSRKLGMGNKNHMYAPDMIDMEAGLQDTLNIIRSG